ncbi:MAG: hypothetical protein K6W08_07930 [Firmicutes bacterium]|jgi:hypothetical protein|nr:hypothetical protein [Bacillota bacterium]
MKGTLRIVAAAIAAALLVFGTATLGTPTSQAPVMRVADGDMGGGF